MKHWMKQNSGRKSDLQKESMLSGLDKYNIILEQDEPFKKKKRRHHSRKISSISSKHNEKCLNGKLDSTLEDNEVVNMIELIEQTNTVNN